MSTNRKVKIQHLYTTGSTIPADILTEGEIAIAIKPGEEGIFFKNDDNVVISPTFAYLPNISNQNLALKHVFDLDLNQSTSIDLPISDWIETKNQVDEFLTSNGELTAEIDTLHEIVENLGGLEEASDFIQFLTALSGIVGSGIAGYSLTDKINSYEANETTRVQLDYQYYITASNKGVHHLYNGNVDELLPDKDYSNVAASVNHYHTNYVKKSDFENGSDIIISCGTYDYE